MKGINYYHESMGYISKDYPSIVSDINLIKSKYQAIKIYHNPFTPNTMDVISTIVRVAKQAGLYVVWNENDDNTVLTAINWPQYVNLVQNDCVIANVLGVDEFLVGNEISIHNDNSSDFNDTNLPIKIKALATLCQQETQAIVSFQDGWWKKDAWHNAGLDNISKLYFTLYETEANFEQYARSIQSLFGVNQAVIGEWSTQDVFANIATDEIDWTKQLERRQTILNSIQFDNYIFCFRDTGANGNDQGFGLWKNSITRSHLAWNMI